MISSESSMEIVESSDDLLMNILVRLPLISAFKFMFVSNRWKNIITDPYFQCNYQARLGEQTFRRLAFIQTVSTLEPQFPYDLRPSYRIPSQSMDIITVHPDDNNYVVKHVQCNKFGLNYGFFIASSNGLVLTGLHSKTTYYVMNILTSDYVALPPPLEIYRIPVMALLYDEENKEIVPKYKIISAPSEVVGNKIPMQIYSSNTRKWTKSILKGVENFVMGNSKPPVVLNGFLHWYSTSTWSLVVLDTRDLIVDGGENHVQMIMLPNSEDSRFNPQDFTFTRTSTDQLWFGKMSETVMRFWMLRHKNGNGNATIGKTEWVLMNTICLDSLHKDLTPSVRIMYPVFKKMKTNKILLDEIESGYLRLGALIPWNGTVCVVICLYFGQLKLVGLDLYLRPVVCVYNLQNKSHDLVSYCGYSSPDSDWYPLMEPLNLSSCGSLS